MQKQKLLISRTSVWNKLEELKKEKLQFTVSFIKKDGTVRVMTAMLGVQAGVNGKGMSWNPEERGMIAVHECHNKALAGARPEDKKRIVNVMTLLTIKIKGETYQVVDNFSESQIESTNKSILEQRKLAKMRKDLKKQSEVAVAKAA